MTKKLLPGFTLLEVIISITMLLILTVVIYPTIAWINVRNNRINYDNNASLLLQEGNEVAYNVLLGNWSGIGSGTYMKTEASGKWNLTSAVNETNIQGRYTRIIAISNICRNLSTGAQEACGTVDANSKKVTTTVSWTDKGAIKNISSDFVVFKIL